MAEDVLDATGRAQAQGRGARESVHCGPYLVTGNLRRIGEEEEGAAGQGGVEEVLASAAEDFLAQHHAEADAQRHLPERDARRQGQGEEHGGDEEAFVHFMAANGGEQHFPETADDKSHRIDGQEPGRALDEVVPQAVRIEAGQRADQGEAPALLGRQQFGALREYQVGLVADVPHAEEHGREGAEPDGDHHALEVDAIAHVGRGVGHVGGAVEEGIHRLVQRVPLLIATALLEVVLDAVEEFSKAHLSPPSRYG
ncbi:hypothetical protein D9M68_406960 [compost metagenome]